LAPRLATSAVSAVAGSSCAAPRSGVAADEAEAADPGAFAASGAASDASAACRAALQTRDDALEPGRPVAGARRVDAGGDRSAGAGVGRAPPRAAGRAAAELREDVEDRRRQADRAWRVGEFGRGAGQGGRVGVGARAVRGAVLTVQSRQQQAQEQNLLARAGNGKAHDVALGLAASRLLNLG
jgi:hypothetical protein